jgi:nanoRNase/pAp phosphatase (c-di-AMP/oligoRNAs hydrolase)
MTLFRRTNNVIIASFRSRNGEALKIAERFQGGGHVNACGATLPRSVKSIPDAVNYLRQILNPPVKQAALNNMENLFAALDSPAQG